MNAKNTAKVLREEELTTKTMSSDTKNYSEEGNIEKLLRAKVSESDSPGFKTQCCYHLANSFISKTERPPHSQACCEE